MSDIKKIAYARYQMDWMLHHNVSLHDICRVFSENGYCQYDASLTTEEVEAIFDDVEFDSGRYVCFDEFLGAEYQDSSYIRTLLNDYEYIEYLKDTEETEKTRIAYLYKEYNDEIAYGEELTEIFEDEDDAKEFLKTHVFTSYGITLEELRDDPLFREDIIDDDYVSIRNDGGDISFFIIEPKPIHGKKK